MDDGLGVILPRKLQARSNGTSLRPSACSRLSVSEIESGPALRADNAVEMLPEQLPTESIWQWQIAICTCIDNEEWIDIAMKEAVKIVATCGELLNQGAGYRKGFVGHCDPR